MFFLCTILRELQRLLHVKKNLKKVKEILKPSCLKSTIMPIITKPLFFTFWWSTLTWPQTTSPYLYNLMHCHAATWIGRLDYCKNQLLFLIKCWVSVTNVANKSKKFLATGLALCKLQHLTKIMIIKMKWLVFRKMLLNLCV